MVADRARCSPWELDDAPSWWVDRVRLALIAENGAKAEIQKRDERRAKLQRMKSGGRG